MKPYSTSASYIRTISLKACVIKRNTRFWIKDKITTDAKIYTQIAKHCGFDIYNYFIVRRYSRISE